MVGLFPQFEYQQAQLEAEVENLSWKVERAEITDRGVRYRVGKKRGNTQISVDGGKYW